MSETVSAINSKVKFTHRQTLIFVLCLIAYTCAYMNRLHISIAIPSICTDLGFEKDGAGIITMSFFWTYAFGQLVSGWLGDRIPPKFMIGVGLGMSSILCSLMSVQNSILGLSIVWALNGVFQSMLWAPIMKVISNNFTGKALQTASFGISFSLVIGHMIAWASSAVIDMFVGWRLIFIIPAAIVFLFVILWFILFKEERSDAVSVGTVGSGEKIESGLGFLKIKYMPAIFLVLIGICITHGLVKEGVGIWFPTLLKEFFNIEDDSAIAVLIVVPVVNFAGLLLTKFISNKTGANSYYMLVALYVISVAVSLVLYLCQVIPLVVLVLVILLCGLMYATNPVLTTFIPVSFTRFNCVSTIAGAMDCVIYVGAALSTYATGIITSGSETSNWGGVFMLWLGTMVLGLLLTALLVFLSKKQNKVLDAGSGS